MELLRFTTAGSVDDGKSTLIGRLLYDSKSIFEDQYAQIAETGRARGDDYVNLALLTDGLRAEREQGITIDVAYRYFATPRRKFIIADTPGHVQYTRNMVTGASTANLAVILIDARNGVMEQSRRHAILASLLGIRHLAVCVNKMDLVGWDQTVYDRIVAEFLPFARRLGVADVRPIPLSALQGDNVVDPSVHMPWYDGPSLLDHLETVDISRDINLEARRFPVQYVIRPMSRQFPDYRGYAGTVAGGVFRPGDAVQVLPAGRRSRVEAVDTEDGPLPEAFPPMAVTLRLADDIDVSRGDMITGGAHLPAVSPELDAMVCWMTEQSTLRPGARLAIKHTTRAARAVVQALRYRLDINTLDEHEGAEALALNEIGRVRLRTSTPLVFDPYAENRATGSFILIDEGTNHTVAGGMILGAGT